MMRKSMASAIAALILGSGALGLTACGTTTTTVVRVPAPKPAVAKTVRRSLSGCHQDSAAQAGSHQEADEGIRAGGARSTRASSTRASGLHACGSPSSGLPRGHLRRRGRATRATSPAATSSATATPRARRSSSTSTTGGPAPGTSTNAQGCYYVKMGEGYCPSTGTYMPMQDPTVRQQAGKPAGRPGLPSAHF